MVAAQLLKRPDARGGLKETMTRLDDQIGWFDAKSVYNQRLFKWLKFVEIVAAASIPVLAAIDTDVRVAAILGALIVVLEGLQHVNQYQSNWISYRSTCEALIREKYLFLARAGPYKSLRRPELRLAQRVENAIAQQEAQWALEHEEGGPHEEQQA
jgi:hypothetical protein